MDDMGVTHNLSVTMCINPPLENAVKKKNPPLENDDFVIEDLGSTDLNGINISSKILL